jgi:hypothetical protein
MANWDADDLLARCKVHTKRPATDAGTTDANWFTLLSDAQLDEYKNISVHAPGVLFGAPTALTSSDSGVTYYFPDDAAGDPIVPMGPVEIYDNLSRPPLRPGTYWSEAGDYVQEGDHIRMPGSKARTFGDGFPKARYIAPPGLIDTGGNDEPTLKPKEARQLIVLRACIYWANRGGRRDPRPYQDDWNKAWFGDPQTGQMGWIYVLKGLDPFGGVQAHDTGARGILDGVDTSEGYTRYV